MPQFIERFKKSQNAALFSEAGLQSNGDDILCVISINWLLYYM